MHIYCNVVCKNHMYFKESTNAKMQLNQTNQSFPLVFGISCFCPCQSLTWLTKIKAFSNLTGLVINKAKNVCVSELKVRVNYEVKVKYVMCQHRQNKFVVHNHVLSPTHAHILLDSLPRKLLSMGRIVQYFGIMKYRHGSCWGYFYH